jgi:glycosyltransferase involved in cell wall biosynthesis
MIKNSGLLEAQEYKPRYSETLINNPSADLDEQEEIKKYFNRHDFDYIKQISVLSSLDKPLDQEVRIIVTIIAYGEGEKIKKTLELYRNQDINSRLFEIVLLENHPSRVSKDNTEEEVKKFIAENPNINVLYAHKVWEEGDFACIGNARKHVFDISLNRIIHRGKSNKDVIIISHDADPISYESNYLSSILEVFDTSPKVDALVTRMSIPEDAMSKPNIAVATDVLGLMELNLIDKNEALNEPADPAIFVGRSCAMRAAIIAACGGCNKRAVVHDDRELGWLISDARGWDPQRIIFFQGTGMVTDPRRHLDTYASGLPVDIMLVNFDLKPEIRQMDNKEVLKMISDDIDWEMLQEDINSTWMSQFSGNKLYAKKFEPAFHKTMSTLGIEYSIVNGNCVLQNIDKLLATLSIRYGRNVNIKHSKPIEWTPEMIKKVKDFFGGLSEGVLGARKLSIGR